MAALNSFSEEEKQYDRYQARQEYLRIQRSIQIELEQARQRANTEVQRADIEAQRAETAARRADIEAQRAETAARRADIETQRAEAAARRADIETQRAEAAARRADIEAQRADEALAEIERLKVLLKRQNCDS